MVLQFLRSIVVQGRIKKYTEGVVYKIIKGVSRLPFANFRHNVVIIEGVSNPLNQPQESATGVAAIWFFNYQGP